MYNLIVVQTLSTTGIYIYIYSPLPYDQFKIKTSIVMLIELHVFATTYYKIVMIKDLEKMVGLYDKPVNIKIHISARDPDP